MLDVVEQQAILSNLSWISKASAYIEAIKFLLGAKYGIEG